MQARIGIRASWRAVAGGMLALTMAVAVVPVVSAATDRVAPTVLVPVARLSDYRAMLVGNGSITVTGHDHGGFGIYGDQFQIAISRNGGTYRTLAWEQANLVDTPDPDGVVRMRSVVVPYNFTFRLFGSPRGNATYRIRARMRDHAGNWSRWMTGPVLRTGLILPTSKSITYSSGWTQAANPLGGSAYAATSPGETATLTFTGRSIAWMAHVGAAYGTAEIRIDGMLVATLDQSRSVTNSFCCSFSKTWGTRATHVLTITPVGPPDHPKVDILGFLILS
jgi:hypothetical protein